MSLQLSCGLAGKPRAATPLASSHYIAHHVGDRSIQRHDALAAGRRVSTGVLGKHRPPVGWRRRMPAATVRQERLPSGTRKMSVDVVRRTRRQGSGVVGSAGGEVEDVELVEVPVVEVAAAEPGAVKALRPARAAAPAGPAALLVLYVCLEPQVSSRTSRLERTKPCLPSSTSAHMSHESTRDLAKMWDANLAHNLQPEERLPKAKLGRIAGLEVLNSRPCPAESERTTHVADWIRSEQPCSALGDQGPATAQAAAALT